MPYAHRFNFVIVDIARDVQYADEFFALLEFLYIFLTRQKVHEVFIKLHKAQKLIPRELGS
jgi:ribosome-binding factor A